MADFINFTTAARSLAWEAAFSADETTLVGDLITSVSHAIESHCRKGFTSTVYDELYDGTGIDRLILQQYPIISVARLATNLSGVILVSNTSTAVQRATVHVTTSGLTLTSVASGVVTVNSSITFAGNVTIQAVADAVNAIGSGWTATVVSGHGLRASSDLRTTGAYGCSRRSLALNIHLDDMTDYEVNFQKGFLTRHSVDFFYEDWCDRIGGFPRGTNRYRVIYTAGYATIPEDVQTACALWVADLFEASKHQPNFQSKSANDATTGSSESWFQSKRIPARVESLLAPYRKITR